MTYYQVERSFANLEKYDVVDFNGTAFLEMQTRKILHEATKQDVETLVKFGLIKELF
jgi:hypothetical protein